MSDEQPGSGLVIKQLFDYETYTYTYLLIEPGSKLALLIDPVKEQFERDMALISELGLELHYVLETHVHADHITSAGMIRQKTGAKIVYGEIAAVDAIDIQAKDGEMISLGQHEIKVIATPGHTNGCVSFYVDGAVFTGDALLIRGCGRTDFQQGDAAVLYQSITKKLFALPDETVVYPGHDYRGYTSSTIAEEKQFNARLGAGRSQQEFVAIMENLNLALPKKIHEAVPANMECGIVFDPSLYVKSCYSMVELHSVWQQLKEDELIVDCRSPEEYRQGHVPGSKNIPLGSESEYVDELGGYSKVYFYCRSGRRAQTATTNLSMLGLNNLACVCRSGMPQWQSEGYPSE